MEGENEIAYKVLLLSVHFFCLTFSFGVRFGSKTSDRLDPSRPSIAASGRVRFGFSP
jgi:hypothetical protein